MPDISLLSRQMPQARAGMLAYEQAMADKIARERELRQYQILSEITRKASEDAATQVGRGRPDAAQLGREGYLADRVRDADLLTTGIPQFQQTPVPSEPAPESWAPGQMSKVDPQTLFTAQNAAVDKMSATPSPGQSTSGSIENSRSVKEVSKAGAGTPLQGLLSDRVAELLVKGVTPDYLSEKTAENLQRARLEQLATSENPKLLNELLTKEIGSYADPAAAQRKAGSDLALKQIQYGSGLLGKMEQSRATVEAANARANATTSAARIRSDASKDIADGKNRVALIESLRKGTNDLMDYKAQIDANAKSIIDPMMATIKIGDNLFPYINRLNEIRFRNDRRFSGVSASTAALISAMGADDTQGQAKSMNAITDIHKGAANDVAMQYENLAGEMGTMEKFWDIAKSAIGRGDTQTLEFALEQMEAIKDLPTQTNTDLGGGGEFKRERVTKRDVKPDKKTPLPQPKVTDYKGNPKAYQAAVRAWKASL